MIIADIKAVVCFTPIKIIIARNIVENVEVVRIVTTIKPFQKKNSRQGKKRIIIQFAKCQKKMMAFGTNTLS